MNAQERASESTTKGGSESFLRRTFKDYEQSKRDDGFVLIGGTEVAYEGGTRIIGGKWFKPEPDEGPDYCRDCCTWDSEEGIWKVTCFPGGYEGLRCQLGHDHHDGEVWLA